MFRTLLFLIFSSLFFCSKAQDSALVNQLLQRIAAKQIAGDNIFTKGNFPSYISNKSSSKTNKKDNNIFFAALVSYTLRQQYISLSQNNRLLADSVQHKTTDLYKHFQNKKGRLTYNFWRTDTAFVFPYTNWIHKVRKNTSLPDDMDDTVLSLMAQDADSARAAEVHALMQPFINKGGNAGTIEKNYCSYKAYSVWYGKNFPPVFDVCVLSNILCFVQQYHLAWTAADSASLDVILHSVQSNDYINKPIYVSPYYGSTSLILYHLARLMSYAKIPQLEALKTKLVVTAVQQLSNTNDLLQKLILSSAIMKLGYTSPALSFMPGKEIIYQVETSDFVFFTGNIPSYFTRFYKHLFTQKGWLLFYHYCPAFNDALLLEYLLLKQNESDNINRKS